MTATIELVSFQDVDRRWPLIVDMVVGCLRKASSDFSPGDVWAQCRSGNWFLFIAWNDDQHVQGFSIWHFTANGYYACVLLAGSEMKAWLPATIDVSTRIAMEHGYRGLAGSGRPGLIRAIKASLPHAKISRVTYVADFQPPSAKRV